MVDEIIKAYAKKKQINIDRTQTENIKEWKEWYKGSNSFHRRNIKQSNGVTKTKQIKTMGLAKKSCEDLTKLIMSEEPEIISTNETINRELLKVLNSPKNDFFNNITILIEKALALGTAMVTEYIIDGEVVLDYIAADNIYPYKEINGYIYGVITITKEAKDGKEFYYIMDHEYSNGIYTKIMTIYEVDKKNGNIKEAGDESYEGYIRKEVRKTEYPAFQIFKNRIANNLNNSPLGISIYANSIDKLKGIDNKYDSLDREFVLGKKRITVSHSAVKKAKDYVDGEIREVQYLDVEDEAWVAIPGLEDVPLKEIEMKLRVTEHVDAINKEISIYSSHIGLGDNYYSFSGQGVKTATEVISNNSEAYKTKTNIQNALYDFIYRIMGTIIELSGYSTDGLELSIKFADSVIEDTNTEKANARIDVAQGLMSKRSYMKKYLLLTDEEVDKELEEMENEAQGNSMFES